MADTMRAQRFYADTKTIAVEDVPIPEPGPGEVLVKVMAKVAWNRLCWHTIFKVMTLNC